jgi:hypothetical protein
MASCMHKMSAPLVATSKGCQCHRAACVRQDAAATLAALAELPALVGAAAAEYEASGTPWERQ